MFKIKPPLILLFALLSATTVFYFVFNFNNAFVQAAFPGWNNITAIYYNPSQDDSVNKFLEKAATELRDHLQKVGKTITINTASRPGSGAIYLEINPALSTNDEAFKLYTDANGIYITGKTPIACRHGAYALLEKLGFRWFFKSPVWNVVPSTLISLDLDEVQEPFYLWRSLWMYGVDSNKSADWAMRNRLYGAKHYSIAQNYASIAAVNNYQEHGSLQAEYDAHPDWFLPIGHTPTGNQGWQLVPDNPVIVAAAKEYARRWLSTTTYHYWVSTDHDRYRYFGAISINPNDAGGWNPPWDPYKDEDMQTITNKTFYLANEVAINIQKDFPGIYILLLSDALRSGKPVFPELNNLEPNILAVVFAPHFNSITIQEQIDGLLAKGVQVGVYDFLEGGGYWAKDNLPDPGLDKVQALSSYAQKGVKVFNGQIGDAWASMGLSAYAASRMLWNPSQDFNAILTDFYAKAFGPAQEIIKTYYETRDISADAVGAGFRNLKNAELLVAGNDIYLERIRQLEYYQRFLWLYHAKGLANLSLDELKSFYTFVTRIKDLYIINYVYTEPALRDELIKRGLTDSNVTALQNFTPPTADEAIVWLNEALAAFPVDTCYTDPGSCMTKGLVGYWNMNEGGGTTANDGSGNSNIGILNGPQWTTGKVGGGLSFDGVNDYVNCGNGTTLQLSGPHTLEAWVNLRAIPSAFAGIVNKYNNSVSPGYVLCVNPGDGRAIYMLRKDGSTYAYTYSDSGIPLGAWTHLVAVYDGTKKYLYVNGVRQADADSWNIANSFQNTTANAYIGNMPSNTLPNAVIDEVRVYNRALSDAEIRYHYNNPGIVTPIPGDLNKDKKVDITDVSIMMSNWGRTDLASLQQCDINPGPNNVSQGKIDLFDANLMMKNWTLT